MNNRLEIDKLRTILLREQAPSTGLTVPEARAKAAAKRGPIVHELVANDLVAEEDEPLELISDASELEGKWRGVMSAYTYRKLEAPTVISSLLKRKNATFQLFNILNI